MKAIDTHYKGYKFRSRLEARYAVYLDFLGIEWEYEVEGFVLSDGTPYLPDFWLPKFNGGMFMEVKPTDFTDEERRKCRMLCEESKFGVWMAKDKPDLRCYEVFYYIEPDAVLGDGIPNADQAEGENRMFAMSAYGVSGQVVNKSFRSLLGETIITAVRRSRAARFEHGQKG